VGMFCLSSSFPNLVLSFVGKRASAEFCLLLIRSRSLIGQPQRRLGGGVVARLAKFSAMSFWECARSKILRASKSGSVDSKLTSKHRLFGTLFHVRLGWQEIAPIPAAPVCRQLPEVVASDSAGDALLSAGGISPLLRIVCRSPSSRWSSYAIAFFNIIVHVHHQVVRNPPRKAGHSCFPGQFRCAQWGVNRLHRNVAMETMVLPQPVKRNNTSHGASLINKCRRDGFPWR